MTYPSNPGPVAPQPGPPGPSRNPGLLKAIAIVAAIVLVATGGFAVNRLLVTQVNGASSATNSVKDFLGALEEEDWTRLGLLLPPDETDQLAGLIGDIGDLQSRLGSTVQSPIDQFEGISVEISDLRLTSEAVEADLTKVSIERATIILTIDARTIESLADLVPDVDPAAVGAVEIEVSIAGPEVTYKTTTADDVETGTETVVVGDREQAPFLMSVRRDGGWFVSPTFTAAQYTAEELGWQTADPGPSEAGYDSPEQALTGFVEGLVETIQTADITHVADAMGGVEARLLKTYAPGINAELEADSDFDFDLGIESPVTIDDLDVEVTRGDNDQARVRIHKFEATLRSEGTEATVVFDGDCVRTVGEDDQGCISDGGHFAERLYGAFGHVVAVPADGGWKISPVATYFDWIAIAQRAISRVDTDLLKAVVGLDFSGLAARDPAATIGSGDEVTVDVEALSPEIYAGVSVVDPQPSPELVDYSCSAETQPGLCEIIVVDGSGRRQERDSRYDIDTGYQFGYEIADDTRLIVLAVAGPVVIESERY
jgi:ketosteroid isomerase-like protein